MKTEPNKQKLMETRAGVLAKPRPRRRKRRGKSGSSHLVPIETQAPRERTRWMSIKELFRG